MLKSILTRKQRGLWTGQNRQSLSSAAKTFDFRQFAPVYCPVSSPGGLHRAIAWVRESTEKAPNKGPLTLLKVWSFNCRPSENLPDAKIAVLERVVW